MNQCTSHEKKLEFAQKEIERLQNSEKVALSELETLKAQASRPEGSNVDNNENKNRQNVKVEENRNKNRGMGLVHVISLLS
jgi:hypothetical protein